MNRQFEFHEEVNCFLDGNKKALLLDKEDVNIINYLKKKGYPIISYDLTDDYNDCWIFQNEDVKREFIDSEYQENFIEYGIRDIYLTGLLLGYPPLSSSEFAYRMGYIDYYYEHEEAYPDMLFINGIVVQYNNLHFVSYTSTIFEDLIWILETNPIKDGKKIIIDRTEIVVKGRKDWMEKLFNAAQYVINKRLNHAEDNNLIIR